MMLPRCTWYHYAGRTKKVSPLHCVYIEPTHANFKNIRPKRPTVGFSLFGSSLLSPEHTRPASTGGDGGTASPKFYLNQKPQDPSLVHHS